MNKITVILFAKGCHDCPFVKTRNDYCTACREDGKGLNINSYFMDKEFHPECPLLHASLEVVKPPKQA